MRNAPPEYQAALDYIYSFINYESKMPPTPQHARFNLGRMRRLLRDLGDPHTQFPSVVVAGTKGKGSTSAMLESILRVAGYRTGLFSSPHLHSWRERIQVDRQLIPQTDVIAYVERLKPLVARLGDLGPPTVFELATALALRYFADRQVDIAVLEIGMGGRYDTVNVVTPLVSVITPISFDHMAVLGSTLPEIASAKAGIIKFRVPVVVAPQMPEAMEVIRDEAAQLQAPLFQTQDASLHLMMPSPDLPSPSPLRYPFAIQPEKIGLGGVYQLDNARIALGTALLLRQQGWKMSDDALAQGLLSARWPGRFEILAQQPTIVVDGAMNGESARRLRESLLALPHRKLILVLGTSRDKDIDAIARELVPDAAAVVLTRSYHPRSAPVETLAEHVRPLLRSPDVPVILTDDIPPALDEARRLAAPDDLICVAGSLFVVAAARETLGAATEID
ncbi:MAG TPA: folylpolyglutamate synthase/dihydrofolate synthase family protein [Herpetosiphonaceae bacterium]